MGKTQGQAQRKTPQKTAMDEDRIGAAAQPLGIPVIDWEDSPDDAEDTHHGGQGKLTWSQMLADNRRFAQGKAEHPRQDEPTRLRLIDGQHPDVVVLSCSDSRVPPEVVFDEGLGDLFTVRSAGQVLDEAVVASLEFAVLQLHVSLMVVLGHQGCGAIQAANQTVNQLAQETLDHSDKPIENFWAQESLSQAIAQSSSIIVRSLGPSIKQAHQAKLNDFADFERMHVFRTIENLTNCSSIIQDALAQQQLMIVGGSYQMDTGRVEVFAL